jgi:hypothetical protein
VDPDIAPVIHNPEYMKPEASRYCGFYYQCVIERIRKSVRKKHISLVETGKADPITDIEEGLMEEVLKEKESKKEFEGYEGIEGEDDDDGVEDDDHASAVDAESAVREARVEMDTSDTSKPLKQVGDDYMDDLVKGKSTNGKIANFYHYKRTSF